MQRKILVLLLIAVLVLLVACRSGDNGSAVKESGNKSSVSSENANGNSKYDDEAQNSEKENPSGDSSSAADSSFGQGSSSQAPESSSQQTSSEDNSSEPIPHSHSFGTKTVAPTCTAGGYTERYCACGYSERINPVSAKGHSFGGWQTVTKPTSSSVGLERRKCNNCSVTEERTLPKLSLSETEMRAEVLRLVNVERENRGLAPLSYYSAGQSAADIRAEEITTSFSHTRPNGSSCFTALTEAGITYYAAGENIAYGYPTPEAVVTAWMNSDGHRANILDPDFTHIIVGVKGNSWVQLFIKTHY